MALSHDRDIPPSRPQATPAYSGHSAKVGRSRGMGRGYKHVLRGRKTKFVCDPMGSIREHHLSCGLNPRPTK